MSQSAAVFLLIALSLLAANLPFLTERPLLILPWSHQGSHVHSPWSRWLAAALLLAALVGAGRLAQGWIGQAVAGGGVQALLFLLRVLTLIGASAALLAAPGWYLRRTGAAQGMDEEPRLCSRGFSATHRGSLRLRVDTASLGLVPKDEACALARGQTRPSDPGQAKKPFAHRLLELLALYALLGTLGVALEANLGSVFPQGWEFYAVTFSLFLVMAYPGFVVCYLFKRRDMVSRRVYPQR